MCFFIPDSIHVSIHYPKGNKRPEIYVSEEEKGEMAKNVKIKQESGVPTHRSPPLHNPETPQSLFHDGAAVSYVPQIVLPTHTKQLHMKTSEERQVKSHHNQFNLRGSSAVGFKNSRQDDPRTRRTHRKKHLKETYWNYKNTPPIRKPVRKSSQNYDLREVKAFDGIGQELLYQPTIEYRDGAVAKAVLPPYKSGT